MNKIREMLNSYINRKKLNEQEIFWCNEISVKYYLTFELNLPYFVENQKKMRVKNMKV